MTNGRRLAASVIGLSLFGCVGQVAQVGPQASISVPSAEASIPADSPSPALSASRSSAPSTSSPEPRPTPSEPSGCEPSSLGPLDPTNAGYPPWGRTAASSDPADRRPASHPR